MSTTVEKNQYQSPKNIWDEFSSLVMMYKPLDLTMGFPDFLPYPEVKKALESVAKSELQENYNTLGQTNLLNVLGMVYSKLLKRKMHPEKEIITMATGCQSLYVVIMALVEQDDEVIIVEPFFSFYETLVNITGGKCKYVPLRFCTGEKSLYTSCLTLDQEELENAFSKKTKIFILNTPNNPSGKVFTLEELTKIAELCKKWNVICLSDEVYEFFVYPPNKHIRIASLEDMWERTITMICPGKTFGVTGWELGVAYSSEELIKKLQIAHQNIVHSNNIPIQEAYAKLYQNELDKLCINKNIFTSLSENVIQKRDKMIEVLKKANMEPIQPEGGFFILADWSFYSKNFNFGNKESKDFEFAKWMVKNVGLAVIPSTSFYSKTNKHLGENYVRLCFLKNSTTLREFEKIIMEFRERRIE